MCEIFTNLLWVSYAVTGFALSVFFFLVGLHFDRLRNREVPMAVRDAFFIWRAQSVTAEARCKSRIRNSGGYGGMGRVYSIDTCEPLNRTRVFCCSWVWLFISFWHRSFKFDGSWSAWPYPNRTRASWHPHWIMMDRKDPNL